MRVNERWIAKYNLSNLKYINQKQKEPPNNWINQCGKLLLILFWMAFSLGERRLSAPRGTINTSQGQQKSLSTWKKVTSRDNHQILKETHKWHFLSIWYLKASFPGLYVHLGALHGLMQNESLPLNGQGVKGRWQHPPADLCLVAELQGSWPHRRQPLHHTAPNLSSYQVWHAPKVMEAGGETTEASCRRHHLF